MGQLILTHCSAPVSRATLRDVRLAKLIVKTMLALVLAWVAASVLSVVVFCLIVAIHPRKVRITQVTDWCKLETSDPSIDWPHVMQSAPFADELLVKLHGRWVSAAKNQRARGSGHWFALALGGGEAVLAGFDSDWKLFRRDRGEPVLADGWTKEGECRPVVAPAKSSLLCLRMEIHAASAYRLQAFDLEGHRTQDVAMLLPTRPVSGRTNGDWPWEIHGFTSTGAPVFMKRVMMGDGPARYRCAFARLDGTELRMAGESDCALVESSAPPEAGETNLAVTPR